MQFGQLKRREFITLLGGAAAWPVAARAQEAGSKHTVGILSASGTPTLNTVFIAALSELGWVEGKNVVFEHRYADNRLERLPGLAADLVRLKVDVIAAAGTLAPLAAKQASSTIPIVMTAAGDPLGSGLVASLARPGGNVTGMSLMAPDLGGAARIAERGSAPACSCGGALECGQSVFCARLQGDAGRGSDIGDRGSILGSASPGRLRWRIRSCETSAP
jgi:putative ABC transport system substrate-binding protein